jgi:hypothetical protein
MLASPRSGGRKRGATEGGISTENATKSVTDEHQKSARARKSLIPKGQLPVENLSRKSFIFMYL